MITFSEKVMQSVRERADKHLAIYGREVLVLAMDPDQLQALRFHWVGVRFNNVSGSDEFKEAVLMLRVLRDMEEVTKAQARLEEALGRL